MHMDANINLLAFGHRVREKGYWSVGITERIDLGAHLPEGLFQFALGGGMQDIEGGINHIDLSGLECNFCWYRKYTEILLKPVGAKGGKDWQRQLNGVLLVRKFCFS